MSDMRRENATLEHYEGPFFPNALDELYLVLRKESSPYFSLKKLTEVAKTYNYACSIGRRKSSTGNLWFWYLILRHGSRFILIAVPGTADWGRSDDTQDDIPIYVYTRGPVYKEDTEKLISELADHVLWEVKDKKVNTDA